MNFNQLKKDLRSIISIKETFHQHLNEAKNILNEYRNKILTYQKYKQSIQPYERDDYFIKKYLLTQEEIIHSEREKESNSNEPNEEKQ